MIIFSRMRAGFVALSLAVGSLACLATPSPDKPVTLLVGYAPGGLADRLARLAAAQLSQETQRSILVKNVSGANGVRAAAEVLQNVHGTASLLLADTSLVIANQTQTQNPIDLSSFCPVGTMGFTPFAISVPAASAIQSLPQLVQFIRQQPDQANFGSPGVFSVHQLGAEMLFLRTHTKAQHIPYQGGAPMLADLLQQRLTFSLLSVQLAQLHLQQQQLRVLAVTGPHRSPQLPQVPTVAESYTGLTAVSSAYLLASPSMERELYQAMVSAWRRIMQRPDMLAKLQESGMEGGIGNDQETTALIRQESDTWRTVLRQLQPAAK